MTSSRNKDQNLALQIIYAYLINRLTSNDFDFEKEVANIAEVPFNDVSGYAKVVTLKALSNYQTIVDELSPYLQKWSWERLPLMSQAILLLAYSHFHYVKDVDKAVVINIAIEQAKDYLDKNEHRFINAILDRVLK